MHGSTREVRRKPVAAGWLDSPQLLAAWTHLSCWLLGLASAAGCQTTNVAVVTRVAERAPLQKCDRVKVKLGSLFKLASLMLLFIAIVHIWCCKPPSIFSKTKRCFGCNPTVLKFLFFVATYFNGRCFVLWLSETVRERKRLVVSCMRVCVVVDRALSP